MTAVWQQVLALDARYNAYRTPENPQFRTVYIRRRSQLLRENANNESTAVRKDYIKIRASLLAQRYGTVISSDQSSVRSRSISHRSGGVKNTFGSADSLDKLASRLRVSPMRQSLTLDNMSSVVPTTYASASRAIAGDTTVEENYAFAGMYHIFDQHRSAVTSVKFAHDDLSRLACCSLDGTISVCQVVPSPATVICNLQGHTKGVTDFVWSLSNDSLLSTSVDGTVRLWSVASSQCLRVIVDPMRCDVLCCAFQPLNNNLFVTGNGRHAVQVYNLSTGKVVKGGVSQVLGRALCLAFDSMGRLLWVGDDTGNVFSFITDIATGRLTKARRVVVCEGVPVTCLSYRVWLSREARDPSLLVNCGANALCLFKIVSEDGAIVLKRKFPIKHRSLPIRSSFCPMMSFRQGACVVSGSEDMCVYIFDVEREARPCINTLQGHSASVLDVCFNYNESLLASCDSSGTVIVWRRDLKS